MRRSHIHGDFWLESLYQGGPILILGLAAAGFRRGSSWRAWLTGDVTRSLVHATVMMCACLLLFGSAWRSPQLAGIAAVGLLTLDLALASRFRGVLSFLPQTTEIDPPPGAFDGPDGERLRNSWMREDDVQIVRNEAAFPRAWIVRRARFPAPITGRSPTDRMRVSPSIATSRSASN